MNQVQLQKNCVLILAQTVIHSLLDVRDSLLQQDVLKNSTKNTDLNNNNYKEKRVITEGQIVQEVMTLFLI